MQLGKLPLYQLSYTRESAVMLPEPTDTRNDVRVSPFTFGAVPLGLPRVSTSRGA